MKPIDILDVPEKIGDAEIIFEAVKTDPYNHSRQILPRRDGNTIVLTDEVNSKFYSLLGGRQFLFTSGVPEENRRLFFGGMDESPFLVELHFPFIESLMSGEKTFFESLKPKIVKDWERHLENKAKRQGDFFAISARRQMEWGSFFYKYLGKGKIEMSVTDGTHLRGTRHKFRGLIGLRGSTIVGEGIIEAPDHEPLVLNGPHLIEQAVGFVSPEKAD